MSIEIGNELLIIIKTKPYVGITIENANKNNLIYNNWLFANSMRMLANSKEIMVFGDIKQRTKKIISDIHSAIKWDLNFLYFHNFQD
jgi:hypothetical protein